MPRTYINFNEWVANNSKTSKKTNDEKRNAQRAKFATCRHCGGQMKYISGTNILICENEVEKKKTKTNEDGTTVEYTVKETCGNINMVDAQYQDYMRYLFD